MRLLTGTIALLICFCIQATPAFAQVITAGPDSVQVPVTQTVTDSVNIKEKGFFLSRWDRPAKAAFFSAVVPGMGQVYNRAYWKVPIIYATGATLGYFIVTNHNTYQDLRKALLIRNDDNPSTKDQYYQHPTLGEGNVRGNDNLRYNRNTFRRNRDFTIILSVVAYGLNVAEAYVHAHLKEFDVSDDLSLRVEPNLMQVPGTATATPGLTLTLSTKTR